MRELSLRQSVDLREAISRDLSEHGLHADAIRTDAWEYRKRTELEKISMTISFWRNRRTMVTGGNGFLGKHLARKLGERGADVHIVDIDRYDLRHLEDTRRALSDANPQMVIHLAARVGGIPLRCAAGTNVGANLEHSAEFLYDNLMTPAPTAGAG